MNSAELVAYLDRYLNIARYPDSSPNGLQVQGAQEVTHIALAVDACLASFNLAREMGAQMLLVHHGLFWGQHQQISGPHYARIKALLDGNLALYACHIPLDAHPELGNNIQLARIAGLNNILPWGAYKGSTIGFIGELSHPLSAQMLYQKMQNALGQGNSIQDRKGTALHSNTLCKRVAVCSGFGVSMIDDALAAGADTLITGETSHQWYQHVAERDISVLYCGHYASETVGIKALGAHLARTFKLESEFIHLPTKL